VSHFLTHPPPSHMSASQNAWVPIYNPLSIWVKHL
jgi:hypothetical protein